ncbi:MAG: ArgR family transcriptional regulator [Spirochaetes bacterium]|nr:ArgR family transcriptional regulator [Spirochaetota bacterium]
MQLKSREDRLRMIRRLIRHNRIGSQEDLLGLLEDEGVVVAQGTLSRDLKYLKVSKVADGTVGYYYTLPSEKERMENEQLFIDEFLRGYVSIDWNSSMVVVKAFSGHATTVALAIDNMNLENVLGTIAGQDNVVFVALRDGYSGAEFVSDLKKKIPDLDFD